MLPIKNVLFFKSKLEAKQELFDIVKIHNSPTTFPVQAYVLSKRTRKHEAVHNSVTISEKHYFY